MTAPRGETPQAVHRRLIVALRQAREKHQLTQKEVADALEWSASKLIRIEKGTVGISVTDLKALLLHYEITDAQQVDRMVKMVRASKQAVWWQKYREIIPADYFTFLGLEASAVRIKQFQGLATPGLLQSPGYVKAIVRASGGGPEQEQLGLEVRLKRQEVISEDGPEALFVIDESVLHRTVGDNAVMREQLLKFKEMTDHPRVTIRILPFSAGAFRGMQNSYELLELSDEPGDYVLLVDHDYKDQLLQVPNEETKVFVELFETLESRALPAEETSHVIDARLKEIEKDG